MKSLFMSVWALGLVLFAPTLSSACGGAAAADAQEAEQVLLKKITGKTLTCDGNGAQVTAVINIYAKYRCIGSPVYGVFKVGSDAPMTVGSIVEDEAGTLTVQVGDLAEPEVCVVK